MAIIIDGKAVAASVIAAVIAGSAKLQREKGVRPGLAVVIVGNDPASHAYVKSKSRMAKQCGFHSVQHSLREETTQEELEALVSNLNDDPEMAFSFSYPCLRISTPKRSSSSLRRIRTSTVSPSRTPVRLRLGTLKAG